MGHGKTLSSSLIGVGASEGLEQSSDVIRFKFKRSLWPEDWPEKRRDPFRDCRTSGEIYTLAGTRVPATEMGRRG